MANFWAGFGQGFLPAFQESRRTAMRERERKEDRQQRLDDLQRAREQQLSDLADARTYAEGQQRKLHKRMDQREREKMMATLMANDPDVQEQAIMGVGGAEMKDEAGSPIGARSLEATDLSRGKLLGAAAQAGRLQTAKDTTVNETAAAMKARAMMAGSANAAAGNTADIPAWVDDKLLPYYQQGALEATSKINMAGATTGANEGAKAAITIPDRAMTTRGHMRSVFGADNANEMYKNVRETFAQKHPDGSVVLDADGNIVDEIDPRTKLPKWQGYLASEGVYNEMGQLAKKWAEYRGVFGRNPEMIPGDADDRGAAISRLQVEIDKEKDRVKREAEVGTPAQLYIMRMINTINDTDSTPEEIKRAKEFLETQGQGQVIEAFDPETGKRIFSIGRRPTASGTGKQDGPSELDVALLNLRNLSNSFDPENPSVGWIATVKNAIGDKVLPQFGIEQMSNPQRIKYRQLVEEFQVSYVKALNAPDSRLSDADRRLLAPLAPNVNDSPLEFSVKVKAIESKVGLVQAFNAAHEGKRSLWNMTAMDVMNARKAVAGAKPAMNDELARFVIRERHGRDKRAEDVIADAQALFEEGKLDDNELKFFLKSALQD